MIPDRLLPVTVAVATPAAAVDRYGTPVPDWTRATVREVRAWVGATASTETADATRDTTTTTARLITNDLGLGGGDRVEWEGRTWEVHGAPLVASTPAGPHHVEALLRAVG